MASRIQTPVDSTARFDPAGLAAHAGAIRRLARSLVADDATADDVAQETMRVGLEHPPRAEYPPFAWLAGIARNVARGMRRTDRRRLARETIASRPDAQPSTADAVIRLAERRRIVDAVLGLREPYRSTLALRWFDGLPPREIARRQGVTVGTAQTRCRRGLDLVRAELDRRHGGDRRAWMVTLLPVANGYDGGLWPGLSTTIGGVLVTTKAKMAAASALFFLLSGGAWIALRAPQGERDPQIPGTAPGDTAAAGPLVGVPRLEGALRGTVELQRELEDSRTRIMQLTAELEATRLQSAAPAAVSVAAKGDDLPGSVREEGARQGVAEATLDAVWRARSYYGANATAREEILASLRPHGEQVIRAAAVLWRTGKSHLGIAMALAGLKVPGGGELLIRTVEEDPKRLTLLLNALSGYDTPQVRDYLVERIGRETDASAFWTIAVVLGELREPRGAEAIRLQQIIGPQWGGVRQHILHAIGRMGGAAAIRLLADYLMLPHADHLGTALMALNDLDPERAQAEARRIKASDRYGFLDGLAVEQVDRLSAK